MWLEESFRDSKSGLFQMHRTRLGDPQRLSRLLMGLTLAMMWLLVIVWPQRTIWLSPQWQAQVVAWGRWSVFRLALASFDTLSPEAIASPT